MRRRVRCSAAIRARVVQARQRATARQGCANQALQGQAIDAHALLEPAAQQFCRRLPPGWGGRPAPRTVHSKVARTIADLAGAQHTQVAHVAEAMQYRRTLHG